MRILLARLRFEVLPCYGACVEARRRPCLEPAERQAQPRQRRRERGGGRLGAVAVEATRPVDPASRARGATDVHDATQECAGGDHDALRAQLLARLGAHACHALAALLEQQVLHLQEEGVERGNWSYSRELRRAAESAASFHAAEMALWGA